MNPTIKCDDASGRDATNARQSSAARRHAGECLECGSPFTATKDADFCGKACRKAFHNRRAARGAEMYDIYMAMRYERAESKRMDLWTVLSRMAQIAREDDEKARDGRRSWRKPHAVIEAKPFLKAIGKGRI